jgi:hypothetical protein
MKIWEIPTLANLKGLRNGDICSKKIYKQERMTKKDENFMLANIDMIKKEKRKKEY